MYNMKTVLVVINVYIMTNAFLTANYHGYRLWDFRLFIHPLITLLYLALNKIVHLKIFNLTYFKVEKYVFEANLFLDLPGKTCFIG